MPITTVATEGEMNTINIAGINKAKLLAALYNGARAQGMGLLHFTPEDMTEYQAQQLLDAGETYFDYVKGRVMKIDLRSDELATYLYNRDNGPGAAERIIEGLRARHQESIPESVTTRLDDDTDMSTLSIESYTSTAPSFSGGGGGEFGGAGASASWDSGSSDSGSSDSSSSDSGSSSSSGSSD